jgi:outer membrane autotransporter protein
VELGRLVLENLSALAAAPVSVDAGATLEYRNVSGALANIVNGTGTLAIGAGSSLAIAHDNAIANTVLAGAVVYLGAPHALSGTAARVSADAGSVIWLAVDHARLGAMTLNGARLGFVHSGTAFKQATLASLDGSNATLEFNVDFTETGLAAPGAAADHLTVTGTSTGTHIVTVNALGTVPGSGETAILLITDEHGEAAYQLAGGKIGFGLTEFELANGAAASSTLPLSADTWYLFGTGLSEAADAIIDTASLLGRDWHYALDALHLRLGDIRAGLPASTSNLNPGGRAAGNIWVRSRGYRLNASNGLSGRGFDQYAYGVTAGGDRAFRTEGGVNLAGGFVDMGRITRDFDGNGDGWTNNAAVGLYGTALKDNGWHADFVLKAERYKHSFEVGTVSGRPVSGRYGSEAYGVSLELGRRLERADGWWLEPSVQAAVAWLGGETYRTTPEDVAIDVKVDGSRAAQYRGQVRFGKQLRDSRWTPYGKFGMVKTDTDGGMVHAHDRDFAPDYDGWRFEAGFGAGYRVNERSQVYMDYEYDKAARYERPWSLNLGYRKLW